MPQTDQTPDLLPNYDGTFNSYYPDGDKPEPPPPPEPGEYTLENGVFTITAPSDVSFGEKPYGAKPWLVWLADDGKQPNASLGRQASWTGTVFRGDISTEIVGAGATQSIAFDHGSSTGAMLDNTLLDHEPDSIVVFRRRYDDFTREEAMVIRVRFKDATITPEPGQWFKGRDSGATGQIKRVYNDSVNMEKYVGTIALPGKELVFNNSEIMDIYAAEDTDFTTSLGTAVNSEGTTGGTGNGAFYTFNNKIIRIWPASGNGYHNAYFSEDSDRLQSTLEAGVGQSGDKTGASFYNSENSHVAREWMNEIFVHRHGENNAFNGMRLWQKNGTALFGDDVGWRTTTDERPSRQCRVYQGQVSNGAEPGTVRYQDILIVDDSEYQVFLVDADGKSLMLPPITWDENKVTAAELPYLPNWQEIQVKINQETIATYPRVEA